MASDRLSRPPKNVKPIDDEVAQLAFAAFVDDENQPTLNEVALRFQVDPRALLALAADQNWEQRRANALAHRLSGTQKSLEIICATDAVVKKTSLEILRTVAPVYIRCIARIAALPEEDPVAPAEPDRDEDEDDESDYKSRRGKKKKKGFNPIVSYPGATVSRKVEALTAAVMGWGQFANTLKTLGITVLPENDDASTKHLPKNILLNITNVMNGTPRPAGPFTPVTPVTPPPAPPVDVTPLLNPDEKA